MQSHCDVVFLSSDFRKCNVLVYTRKLKLEISTIMVLAHNEISNKCGKTLVLVCKTSSVIW